MTDRLVVSFSSYITELVTTFGILKKFKRQIYKLENKLFDKGLGFEKIKVKDGITLYSFRVDIHYRAYLRKENTIFIVFDVNNHDYESIIKKLKAM